MSQKFESGLNITGIFSLYVLSTLSLPFYTSLDHDPWALGVHIYLVAGATGVKKAPLFFNSNL